MPGGQCVDRLRVSQLTHAASSQRSCCVQGEGRGGEISGGAVGSPTEARMRRMVSASVTTAMRRIVPPHLGQVVTSSACTRGKSSAQRNRRRVCVQAGAVGASL